MLCCHSILRRWDEVYVMGIVLSFCCLINDVTWTMLGRPKMLLSWNKNIKISSNRVFGKKTKFSITILQKLDSSMYGISFSVFEKIRKMISAGQQVMATLGQCIDSMQLTFWALLIQLHIMKSMYVFLLDQSDPKVATSSQRIMLHHVSHQGSCEFCSQ